jgi:cyclopropane fatty-acyl-phospholipid synthase-like methyltransferase
MERPFSQSCVNNREPILAVLQRHLPGRNKLLEIGSGTGQHAVYFAPQFPELHWQTSDLEENHAAIRVWLRDYPYTNIAEPLALDVTVDPWPVLAVDAIFTANTLHIMSWQQAQQCLIGAGSVLQAGGVLIVYGPFNYEGRYTSDSNARFDQWLKAQAPWRAIRDFEAVCECAQSAGLELLEDNAMPANNRCLVFVKSSC